MLAVTVLLIGVRTLYPVLRNLLSSAVHKKHQGAVFGFLGFLEINCINFSSVAYNYLYQRFAASPSWIFFAFGPGLLVIALIFTICSNVSLVEHSETDLDEYNQNLIEPEDAQEADLDTS